MTDNELNALVAERVMGIRVDPDDCGCTDCILGETLNSRTLPDYCNDIAAAWRVALKIASMSGYGVTIHVGDEVWIEKTAETDDGSNHLITWQDVARVGTSEGDARAICLAAIGAVGGEVK